VLLLLVLWRQHLRTWQQQLLLLLQPLALLLQQEQSKTVSSSSSSRRLPQQDLVPAAAQMKSTGAFSWGQQARVVPHLQAQPQPLLLPLRLLLLLLLRLMVGSLCCKPGGRGVRALLRPLHQCSSRHSSSRTLQQRP
jgi:hypothetical protein